MGRAAPLIAAGVAFAVGACAPPRPQLVVTVNTDLVVPAQLAGDDTLSAAAAIDRVRVDVLGADGTVEDEREFVVHEQQDLPLSFGVARGPEESARVRVTGFRGAWTLPTGEPAAGVAVERLLEATFAGVTRVDLELAGDCLGRPIDLAGELTCLDAAHPAAPATTSTSGDPAAAPGSWTRAHSVPCAGATPAGMVCIPGGVSAIGDPALALADGASDLIAAPPHTVVVSPFYLDRMEVTVARLRALNLPGTLPTSRSSDARCNYTATAGATDNEAVRCVPFETARAACTAMGGALPTASEWEHAARGRGRGTRYPWGDAAPTCCTAALAGGALGCTPQAAVGSHADPSSCDGLADVSRDGVLDLGGSVREWVPDAARDFDACLPAGVATDPLCTDGTLGPGSTKGGSIDTPLEDATSALRRSGASTLDVGFRCARPAS